MTVNEAIKQLQNIQNDGAGELVLQLMLVEGGITYAYDVDLIRAQRYDGERVWVVRKVRHNPEWSSKPRGYWCQFKNESCLSTCEGEHLCPWERIMANIKRGE